jgi:hypothetical protein
MSELEIDQVKALAARLSSSTLELDDHGRIELIGALEDLKNVAAAAQARAAADLDASVRAAAAQRGVPAARRGRGVAVQVALARRESEHVGAQHLGLAKILRDEMPHTEAAFRAGRVSEWRATLLARETACLSFEHRQVVDLVLAGDPDALAAMGDGELVTEAKKLAYRLDPRAVVRRRAKAEADRHVSVRPAPDVMTHLSALLPVKDGVGVHASLKAAADAAIAAGDGRSRGQLMADLLVARITGRGDDGDSSVSVTIDVVVPDTVLTGQSDEAAYVDGYGPVPADLARELAEQADWLRRLYAEPATGSLVGMDSVARIFPDGLKRFLRLRDRTCRMPWCDAPVRHADHVHAAVAGGPTSAANGQGLCVAHNLAKQAHGWQARPRPGPRHTVETITPTGHTYVSCAPPAREPRYVETRAGVWTLIA